MIGLPKEYKSFAAFCAILLLLVAFTVVTGYSACASYALIGLPCPGCGLTRAWLCALKGDFIGAFRWHPLFPLALVAPLPLLTIKGKTVSKNTRNVLWVSLGCVFIAVWALRMALYFPHTPPMNINYGALVFKLFGTSI